MHGKENPNQLPLSVLLTSKIFEAARIFLMLNGHRSCASAKFRRPSFIRAVMRCGLAAQSFPGATPARRVGSFRGYPFVIIFLAGYTG